jgi:hypothetical protein
LMNNLRVQVLPHIEDLVNAKKNQNAAFIASEQLLVVWDDDAMNLIPRARAIEEELLRLVMNNGVDEKEEEEDGMAQKRPAVVEVELDEETGEYVSKRPTNIMNSNLVRVTLCLIIVLLGLGFREIALEIKVDMDWKRLAFLALTPVQIFFTLVSDMSTLRNYAYLLSSSHKLLLGVLHNALDLSNTSTRTQDSIQACFLYASRGTHFPMSPYNVLYTRKVSTPLLRQQSNQSRKPFQLMNFKEDLLTCSSMTMVSKLSTKKNVKVVSTFTLITALAGLLGRNTARMVSSARESSRKPVT